MYWEDYDILVDEVMVVGDSEAFHFLVDLNDSPSTRVKSACGNAKSYHSYEASTREDARDMIDDGKRPCKQCVRALTKFYDIEAYTCELCDRLNLMQDVPYFSRDIEYAAGGEKTVQICLNCKSRFKMDW